PMRTFVRNREDYLNVMMILKGRGDHVPETCPTCPPDKEPTTPVFRCMDCFQGPLSCQDCCIEQHVAHPLHRIQVCDRFSFFLKGHSDKSDCSRPIRGPSKFIVVHTNGVHRIRLNYCGCHLSISSSTSLQRQKWEQLMRCRWFPATHAHPRTTFTFQFLEQFHIMNLSGKINLYDYYKAIEKLTDNTGGKIPVCSIR
ncbi:hypothetical protein K435DRAFT_667146, partial [Dendrothele bispora CBS 962.96]